ncbi:MAG TPA: aminotransferase class I/II-fold pyridoxal phosphate-dependent enzyme [Clostridiaceae bacterium]|nr:aminotransferase class I/II-fold pyridoxal phosphate-dependent enzyme [Clostridiaceae bacterium]
MVILIKKLNAPLYQSVRKYAASKPVPFHMPGHKLGRGLPDDVGRELLSLDVTEIPGMDNLHAPEGVIREAQELAAKAFGADKTYFLVNGSSSGIHAMIMALCKPGDKLIVSRDCHKSVIAAMILAGVRPVYVLPEFNSDFAISETVDVLKLTKAIELNPDAAGVLITRPNYYGICSDVERIAKVVHSRNMVLMVDEAHGAHLGFSSCLPKSAMEAGADICVQSAHKTLPALTQGAYLHVKSRKVDIDRLEFFLDLLQTTSPSYIIMSMLDIARCIMDEKGAGLLKKLLAGINSLETLIDECPGMRLLKEKDIRGGSLDKTRMVINLKEFGRTGYETEKILRDTYNIQVEMSDFYNIVCITTVADEAAELESLGISLADLSASFRKKEPLPDKYAKKMQLPEQAMELKDIKNAKCTKLPLSKAAGRISRSIVTPYPPGIPLVCPGEIIMEETVEYVYNIIEFGGKVNGLSGNMEVLVVD